MLGDLYQFSCYVVVYGVLVLELKALVWVLNLLGLEYRPKKDL